MKFAMPAIVLAVLIAAGCQDNKKTAAATDSGTMDLTANNPMGSPSAGAYAPAPQPVMAQPVQTAAPDTTSAGTINAGIAPAGNTYTIRPGDTLWKIAATHYGDGRKWHQIVDANAGLEPSKLRVGQTITLP